MTKSEFKKRVKYDLSVLNDWFVQRSNLYYNFMQKHDYQAKHRKVENSHDGAMDDNAPS